MEGQGWEKQVLGCMNKSIESIVAHLSRKYVPEGGTHYTRDLGVCHVCKWHLQ